MPRIRRIFTELISIPNWLCICIFLVLTGAASDFRFLQISFAEQISFVVATALMMVHFLQNPRRLNARIWLVLTAMLGLLLSIAMSSIANDHMLTIVGTSKYRQLVKIFVIGAGMWAFADAKLEARLKWSIMAALALLVVHGGYRFLVLNEFNPETGRMNLLMRHGNANYIASICGGLSFAVLYGLGSHGTRRIAQLRAVLSALAVCGAILIVVASQSRMGLIALLTGAVVLGGLESHRKRNAYFFIGLALIVLATASIGLSTDAFARFADITDPSSLGRVKGIRAGIELFADSPFLGVGYDQTPHHIYQITGYPMFRDFASPPLSLHNSWFQMLSEMGLIGFAFFTIIWLAPIRQAASLSASWKKSCLIAGWCCIFLNQQTLPAAYNDAFFALALLPGVLSACLGSKVSH